MDRHYYQLSMDSTVNKHWKKNKFCKAMKRKTAPNIIEEIFQRMLKRFRRVRAMHIIYSNMKITKILDQIIMNDYFGTSKNRKRFYQLVNRITTQSRFECVHSSTLCNGYDIQSMDWLQKENLDEKKSRKLLAVVNRDLLKYIVKPLIKHFYHPLKCLRDYEVKFIKKSKWQSFQTKSLNTLLKLGHLLPKDGNNVRPRGILRLFPKTDCDSVEYRPVMCAFKRNIGTKIKLKNLSKIISKMAIKISDDIGSRSLFTHWMNFTSSIPEDDIFGVKLDVKDAFGNVDIPLICQVITDSNFNASDKFFVVKHIQNQYVQFNKNVYQWTHGLLQGDHLSSSLCDLYMSVMERKYLHVFLGDNVFLHRFVDDYMMCSTNPGDVHNFVKTASEIYELNESKTEYAGENGNHELTYYGQVFNLKTREVSKLYRFEKDKSIRYKFKFWNIAHPIREQLKKSIILNTLKFCYNNHCFKKLEINSLFNTEQRILVNFFKGMIFIAFKFDAAVMAIRDYEQNANELPFLSEIIEYVIHNYTNIVFYRMKKCLGAYSTGSITYRLLRNISFRAFILVLKKNYAFYNTVINILGRSEKVFYLYLDNVVINPNEFMKLPTEFENIKISRRSQI